MRDYELINAGMRRRIKRNDSMQIKSNFNFLKNHNGWREGKLHLLLGPTSGGKSTLLRSVVIDLIESNPKIRIGIWLSEESPEDVEDDLFRITGDMSVYDRVLIGSELQVEKHFLEKAQSDFREKDFDIFIFDNITTSQTYEGKSIEKQSECASELKKYAEKKNIPVIVISHTRADSGDKLLSTDDVRGSKHIANITQFFYALQTFTIGHMMVSYIVIHKARGQSPKCRIFRLVFNSEKRVNTRDIEYTHEQFKEHFKSRNKLI